MVHLCHGRFQLRVEVKLFRIKLRLNNPLFLQHESFYVLPYSSFNICLSFGVVVVKATLRRREFCWVSIIGQVSLRS